MTKFNSNRKEGFTIIEVMIVLAIAGLIMLIVFLAVPALQRNSRNTQRKNDVSLVLAAMSEWVNNHNGVYPTSNAAGGDFSQAVSNTKLGFFDATGAGPATAKIRYDIGTGAITNPNSATGNIDIIVIGRGAKCDPAANGNAVRAGASSRQAVALYAVETSSGITNICQES